MRSAYTPYRNGYCFGNSDITWSIGPFTGKALCGGMSYSSIDYYVAGMQIPQNPTPPQEGEALHNYIYARQTDAHLVTVHRFVDKWTGGGNVTAEWDKLLSYIRAGQPIPLCLYNQNSWKGHHTVACAVTLMTKQIELYDPNYPSQPSFLRPENGNWKHTPDNSIWTGFFVDDGYSYKKPPVLVGKKGWLRCMDCRLLYQPGAGAKCPKGGSHNPMGSAKYVLAENGGNGQNQWRECIKCSCLFYQGSGAAGACPAGGIHAHSGFDQYVLASGGEGQNNWRRCVNCEGLFWLSGGGIGGLCPSGDRHKSDLSRVYTVPFQN